MSIRCSGLARRSFIIGSRLWPPAMIAGVAAVLAERRDRALDAGRALIVEWRWGLHQRVAPFGSDRVRRPRRHPRMRGPPTSASGSYWTGESVPMTGERGSSRRRAARGRPGTARSVATRCRTTGCAAPGPSGGGGDRRLASEPRERQRAARVDLADPRRLDLLGLREVAQPAGGGARVEPVDQPDGVASGPAFLTSRPSSASTAASRLRVDVAHDRLDRRGLLDQLRRPRRWRGRGRW